MQKKNSHIGVDSFLVIRRCFQVIGKFCEKINFIKVFETAIRSYIVIIFGILLLILRVKQMGKWSLIESAETKQLVIFSG